MAVKSKGIDVSPITRLQGQFRSESYLGETFRQAGQAVSEGLRERRQRTLIEEARLLQELKIKIDDANRQYLGDDVDKFIDKWAKRFQEKRGGLQTKDWIELSKDKNEIDNKEAKMTALRDIYNKESSVALREPGTYYFDSSLLEVMLEDIDKGNAISPVRCPFTNMVFVKYRPIDMSAYADELKLKYRKAYEEEQKPTEEPVGRIGKNVYTRYTYGTEENARNYALTEVAKNQQALANMTIQFASLPKETQDRYIGSKTSVFDWFMEDNNITATFTEPKITKGFTAWKPDKPDKTKQPISFEYGKGKPTTIDKTRFNDYFSLVNLPSSKRSLKAITIKGAQPVNPSNTTDAKEARTVPADYEIMGYDGDRDVIVLRQVKETEGQKAWYIYFYIPRIGNEELLEGRLEISGSRGKVGVPLKKTTATSLKDFEQFMR